MKIAVAYENGEVFQHFGHTEQFKIYDAEDGKIVSAEMIRADQGGHGALASLLGGHGVDVVICGGIGQGARNALEEQGIVICPGVTGSADEAAEAYLGGGIETGDANCDHHSSDSSCGEGGCDPQGCGGCHGCCPPPAIEGKNVGKTCRTHYIGTFNDGTQFDSSYDRGEPLEFVCGAGMMIRGFDEAVADMEVGESRQIHLMPSQAYGEADPNAVFTVELAMLPGIEEVPIGERIYLTNAYGNRFGATIVKRDEKTVTFDANHEMAGKELNFQIELVEVRG